MDYNINFQQPLAGTGLQTEAQEKMMSQKKKSLWIGIPKESSFQENRIALAPSAVQTLVSRGHRVVIEADAGEKSNFSNHDYSEAGADIAYSADQVFKADMILKVAPPTLEEVDLLSPNQIVISPIHLPTLPDEYLMRLKNKRVIALAMEYIKDSAGSFPIVRIMSEIAGISSMLTAGELLSNKDHGRGVLLGGISGIPPTKVVILGAGVVAEHAAKTALGLGAAVSVFDDNVHKLMRLRQNVGQNLYTSTINPVYLKRELEMADVAIGAMHSETGRTPCVVSEPMVENMRRGSVIIDVSIDQGGCFATSRVTSHSSPTFIKHDVIHYCVPNIASRVSRTASRAISNIMMPLLLQGEGVQNFEELFRSNAGLRHGIYAYKGCITNAHLSERFNMKHTNIDLLLPATMW